VLEGIYNAFEVQGNTHPFFVNGESVLVTSVLMAWHLPLLVSLLVVFASGFNEGKSCSIF